MNVWNVIEKFVFVDNDGDGKENEDCVIEFSKK